MFEWVNLWAGRTYGLALELTERAQEHARELRSRQDGQALVEYALILALISVVAITALTLIGSRVTTKLTSIANALV